MADNTCAACAHWEQFAGAKAAGHCEINKTTTLDLARCSAWHDKTATAPIEEPSNGHDPDVPPPAPAERTKRRRKSEATT